LRTSSLSYNIQLKIEFFDKNKVLKSSHIETINLNANTWASGIYQLPTIQDHTIFYVKFSIINPNTFVVYLDNWKIEEKGKVILQENHYYPYGKEIVSLGRKGNPNHEFLYQGKERNEEFGLEQDDFEWRMYDFNFPRTTTIDPHAENYYSLSPYSWVGCNPIMFIDPDGRDFRLIIDLNDKGEISKVTIQTTVHLYGNSTGSMGKKEQGTLASNLKKHFDGMEKSSLINFDVNFKEHKSKESAIKAMKDGDNLMKVDTNMSDEDLKTFHFYGKVDTDVSNVGGLTAKMGGKEANVRNIGSVFHELGHLLGLDERYGEDPTDKKYKNFLGFGDDIMGLATYPNKIKSVHSENLYNYLINDTKHELQFKKRQSLTKVYSNFGGIPEPDNEKKFR
jgi:RHS repeat-associated protein